VPEGTRDAVTELVEVTHSGVAPFIQHAGLAAVRDHDAVQEFRSHCATGRTLTSDALSGINGVRYTAPDGAFYAFVGVEGLTDSLALAKRLVTEQGVAVAPGIAFGAAGEGFLRICFAHSADRIERAMGRLRDGLRAALDIRAAQPGVGVLVLSQFLEDAYAFALVADGAQGVGYLLKEKVGDLRTFTDAVRRVAEGGSVLDPDVVARLVGRKRKATPLDDLTPRERQVLTLIAEGRSNSGIAQEMVERLVAMREAGLQASDVGYVNAHGAGTREGDAIEISALAAVFGEHAGGLAVSSTKSMHGHALGAAGAIEALITVLAVARDEIPPTANLQEVAVECQGVRHVMGQGLRQTNLRVALSNSFAFGGSNAVLAFRSAS